MKIVYFDYWTGGIHNFKAIDFELKKLGHNTLLFHIGSFNESVESYEIIENIDCFDISHFKTKLIFNALKEIKPDFVISLNTTYIFDRVLIQSCKVLNIRTIFMMHGIRATGKNLDQAIIEMESSYGSIYKKLSKASKYFFTVIPNYIVSSYKFDFFGFIKLRFIKVLLDYFFNTGRAFYYPLYPIELIHDKCLVYANKYIEYYEKLGYKIDNISVVGDPKQDFLFSRIENNNFNIYNLPESIQLLITNNQRYALYLEDSFVESGNLFGWTNEDRNNQINEIANRLKRDNIKLVLKIHPTTIISNIEVDIDNCIVIQKTDLENLIFYSYFCIAHISSTVNISILLNKPVLVPQWNKSKKVTDYFISNCVANKWGKLDDELNLEIDEVSRKKYIKTDITVVSSTSLNSIIKEVLN